MRATVSPRRRAEQNAELSFRTTLSQARYANALEAQRAREARQRARWDALQPLLAKAGYGPHGVAPRLRAEARDIGRAAAARGTECSGPDCQVCADGRRRETASGSAQAERAYNQWFGREITRAVGYNDDGEYGNYPVVYR